MMPSSGECSGIDRRKVRAEAAAWLARLHGPNRGPTLEAGLRHWLAEHPLHAREFELATDVWDESGGESSAVRARGLRRARSSALRRVALPIAASIAAAMLAVAWFIQAGRGTQVSTGVGEQRTIILADGSRLTLNTSTRAAIEYTTQARTVILKDGEAYFDVVHDAKRPFIVRVDDHQVIDLGTRFIVNRAATTGDSLTVTVIEGRVAVAPIDTSNSSLALNPLQVHIVTAGQLLRIHTDSMPVIRPISVDGATAWLNGQIVFDSTPLAEAAAEFNRYSSLKIRVLSSKAGRIPVGGVFRIGDSASFARAVADSHHLRLITGNEELLLEPSEHAPSSATPSPP